jgi:hypothetical protein
MSKFLTLLVCLTALLAPSAFATVSVTSPVNDGTYSTSVQFIASATTTTCSKGVGSMGIYTAPYQLAYVVNGASMNHTLSLSPGTYNTTVEEWDNCGGATTAPVTITVQSGGTTGVTVTSPANDSTVGSPVNYVATATTTCSKGVSSMGIYTAPSVLAYVVQGASMNYNLALNPGTYDTVVEEWDGCGGASTKPVTITVSGSSGSGGSFSELQHASGWGQYGQRAPTFVDCSPSPCDDITFTLTQNVKSPSMSGESAEMYLAGSEGYGDALFNNHLIGVDSSQGMPDTNHTLIPTLHNFTYDVYFYTTDLSASQALEFDINQFFNNQGWIWGHQCTLAGANVWDIWDNVTAQWVPTNVPCNPINNAWNHLTIQVQRTSSNQLLYQTITLNGTTYSVNQTYSPGTTDGWYGVTINYQQDGNYEQSPYSVYLDEITFTYN